MYLRFIGVCFCWQSETRLALADVSKYYCASIDYSEFLFQQMAMSDSNNSDLSSGLSNHKRSHSFNNHQSYTQHTQQTQKNKQTNASARWLLNSCDSLDQSSAKPNKTPIGKKFSSVDFIDIGGSGYSSKGKLRNYNFRISAS